MLARHIIGYLPSLVVPAAAAFVSIYCFTRLLTPQEYGHYALALSTMTLLNAVFFYWLQVSLPRFMPQAVREGQAASLRVTTYIAYLGASLVLIVLTAIAIPFMQAGDMRIVALFAVPLALARSLLNMNQAFHRSGLNFRRYNIIECGQAVLGLAISLLLIVAFHMGNIGAILGLLAGMALMTLIDLRLMFGTPLSHFSRKLLTDLVRFGMPLVVSYGLGFIISSSDRFLIEHFQGAGDVGVYAAGYSLMDRINTIVFMVIATPSYPLTMNKLEHEGIEAARRQTYLNGMAAFGLALPASVGLIMTNADLAQLLIGADFRAGALRVMPWIAVSGLLNGLATHYFDHAFHLAKRPQMLLLTQGPTAALNLGLNLVLIPRIGYMGAAYSTLGSYALLLLLSIVVGRRAFRISFPIGPAIRIAGAALCMAIAIAFLPLQAGMVGLVVRTAVGGIVYVGMIWLLDVGGVRQIVARRLPVRAR